eukprot:9470727-Pyramimonas_sp.AAC.1
MGEGGIDDYRVINASKILLAFVIPRSSMGAGWTSRGDPITTQRTSSCVGSGREQRYWLKSG